MVSVRARLALWYAGVFALFLGAFSAAGYVLVARSSLARVDESLLEGVVAVAAALDLEAEDPGDPRQFIPHVVEEFRFHDLAVAVLEKGTGRLLAGWSADSESTDTITSPQVNGALARAGLYAGTVTATGALTGLVIGTMIVLGGGWGAWGVLLATFFTASVCTRVGQARKTAAGIAEERGGRRGK